MDWILGVQLHTLSTLKLYHFRNLLKFTLAIDRRNDQIYTVQESNNFELKNEIHFQVRVVTIECKQKSFQNAQYNVQVLFKCINCKDDDINREVEVSSEALQFKGCIISTAKDEMWRTMHWGNKNLPDQIDFRVNIIDYNAHSMKTTGYLSFLYEDEKLTDFELCGEDGAVSVHKAVVAAASPVLRAMVQGPWDESKQGSTQVKDTTRATLLHLKDYIYLGTLPDHGVNDLMLLANYYQMCELREVCKNHLIDSLTPANLLDQTEFAVNNKLTDLLIMIFKRVKAGDVQLDDVEDIINTLKE